MIAVWQIHSNFLKLLAWVMLLINFKWIPSASSLDGNFWRKLLLVNVCMKKKNWTKKQYTCLLCPWCPFSFGKLAMEASLWFKFFLQDAFSVSWIGLPLNKYHPCSVIHQSVSFLFLWSTSLPIFHQAICAIIFCLQTPFDPSHYLPKIFVYFFSDLIAKYKRRWNGVSQAPSPGW